MLNFKLWWLQFKKGRKMVLLIYVTALLHNRRCDACIAEKGTQCQFLAPDCNLQINYTPHLTKSNLIKLNSILLLIKLNLPRVWNLINYSLTGAFSTPGLSVVSQANIKEVSIFSTISNYFKINLVSQFTNANCFFKSTICQFSKDVQWIDRMFGFIV